MDNEEGMEGYSRETTSSIHVCPNGCVHYSTIAHILSIIPLPPCVGRIACGVWGWSVAGVSRTPVYHLFHAFFSLTP